VLQELAPKAQLLTGRRLADRNMPERFKAKVPWIIGVAVVLVFDLFVATPLWQSLLAEGLALGLIFLSYSVLTGMGGIVSLAQGAIVTLAAIIAGICSAHGFPFFASLLIGVLVAVAAGAVVAAPALRLTGIYLALASLALALVADQVLFEWYSFTNGTTGWVITPPSVGFVHLSDARTFTVVMLIIDALVIAGIRRLRLSSVGRGIVAVRWSRPAALSSGVSIAGANLRVFCLSAAIAAFGGVMLGSTVGGVTSQDYPTSVALVWLVVVASIGIRSPGRCVAAGLIYACVPQLISWFTNSAYIPQILFGLGAIGLASHPEGVVLPGRAVRRWLMRARRNQESGSPTRREADGHPTFDVGIELRSVDAGYGTARVLHSVSALIRDGCITAVIGANGAGKSTLCSVLAGLISPTGGEIFFRGTPISRLNAVERVAKGIVVAPETRGIFPGLSVHENLAIWLKHSPDIAAVYDRFPLLAARRRSPAGNLSGGEQQILALAPVLVRRPPILILDEPTLGLAPMIVAELLSICVELRNAGTTILVTGERAKHLLTIADDVLLLRLGRIVWSGKSADLTESRLDTAYLGEGSSTTGDVISHDGVREV
jgi:ABC-type branched-subunit amino acid transport system ATPase component/ABC-type branched-subunit amino acid transport system permease subunit